MVLTAQTGYGPSPSRVCFDGDADKFELWEVKFRSYLRIQKLLGVIDEPDATKIDPAQNARVFSELVILLDDRSLSLVIRDARDDGRRSLSILREHYMGHSKPRIIALYTELTSLKLGENEDITNFIIRAEKSANSLKQSGETISDGLLVAMVLKGLPSSYRTFCTVISPVC